MLLVLTNSNIASIDWLHLLTDCSFYPPPQPVLFLYQLPCSPLLWDQLRFPLCLLHCLDHNVLQVYPCHFKSNISWFLWLNCTPFVYMLYLLGQCPHCLAHSDLQLIYLKLDLNWWYSCFILLCAVITPV
jgi:hypothetical protein